MKFSEAWDFIVKRSQDMAMPVVQDKEELAYVYGLLEKCKSYLEVGTAEGNSLYVLAKAMPKGSFISFIDLGENHTEKKREYILELLRPDYDIRMVLGDSTLPDTQQRMISKLYSERKDRDNGEIDCNVDCVLIDGGHDFPTVLSDAILYGHLADKYIIFHDVQLPPVAAAYDWYRERYCKDKKTYRVVNSDNYGYGVIEV